MLARIDGNTPDYGTILAATLLNSPLFDILPCE